MELITGKNDKDRRLDRILRKALPDYPLPLIHKLLRQKKVLVDGKPGKAEDRLDCGVRIYIKKDFTQRHIEPAVRGTQNTEKESRNKNTDSPQILWENADLIAVFKTAGIAVHGVGSLEEIMGAYLKDKLPPSLSFKPGPLHRLDKPSSGAVVFSKSLEGARLFTSLMRERKIRKTYLAVVEGIIKSEENWRDELVRDRAKKKTFISDDGKEGKTAITNVTPLCADGGYTLIKAEIETGRTHQIRAQAASHGHPLAGDVKYGGKKNKEGFFLHAWKLEFLNYTIEAPVKLAVLNMDPNCLTDGVYKRLSVFASS
ncbi:MAG: RluA family pseudouridine synthase [Treponema sp.]|nr:RluA family pseudouridine synthase [Treponema sp.]